MSFPQPPIPGDNYPTPFSLMTFMMSDALTDDDKIECWKTIDIVRDNLLHDNGGLRRFSEIQLAAQQPLQNPALRNAALLTGVNFAREVYRWLAIHNDSGLLDESVARLGQSKPFLRGLHQYLTLPERENRKAEESDPKPNTPFPHNELVKSMSDALAVRYWARVQPRRPVNPAPADVPKTFQEKELYRKRICDGISAEPKDMVEADPDSDDEDEEGEENNKATSKKDKKKEVHPQVQRVRDMSDLKKYILSWDWLESGIDAENGTPDVVLYNNDSLPKNGRYKDFKERVSWMQQVVSRSKASVVNSTQTKFLPRFAAHPRYELSVKLVNKKTNSTRTKQVKAGQQVLAKQQGKPSTKAIISSTKTSAGNRTAAPAASQPTISGA
ncbi:hypothetical protein QBC45DRAFT_464743 [Copromyces sp. CBS 386.78]|nr:hypothetical protein QBC45DRAFT_464743 [Copromyces sp. CBS 386.78]